MCRGRRTNYYRLFFAQPLQFSFLFFSFFSFLSFPFFFLVLGSAGWRLTNRLRRWGPRRLSSPANDLLPPPGSFVPLLVGTGGWPSLSAGERNEDWENGKRENWRGRGGLEGYQAQATLCAGLFFGECYCSYKVYGFFPFFSFSFFFSFFIIYDCPASGLEQALFGHQSLGRHRCYSTGAREQWVMFLFSFDLFLYFTLFLHTDFLASVAENIK